MLMIHRIMLVTLSMGIAFHALSHDGERENNSVFGSVMTNYKSKFVPIYIEKIRNMTGGQCSIESLPATPEKTTRVGKLLVPFISIATYLRKYADNKKYTPEGSLKIQTPQGKYRLWASESGVMCAPDPQDEAATLDSTWEAEKILGTTARELTSKKEFLATLVLKATAHQKKTNISLEPAHA